MTCYGIVFNHITLEAGTTAQIASMLYACRGWAAALYIVTAVGVTLPRTWDVVPTWRSEAACHRHALALGAIVRPTEIVGVARVSELYPIVVRIPNRNPIVTHKRIATVHRSSRGRLPIGAQFSC